ncbi:MAG: NAD(P)/FAD-dependent oxidoreductase [Planctomycetaceae bacterium]|nr:NAD(P)/FAD-dependent oxidoreductase [Planctomycetaceae bacterium]
MSDDTTRIIVLGGGFAGAYCVRRLERRLASVNHQITLINERNNFVFTPMLLEAATSALEPRHVVIPLRGFLRQAELVMAHVDSVDLRNRTVTAATEFGEKKEFAYDHLVLALGSETRMPDVPGLKEFAFGVKTLGDAATLRDRAIGMLEMANLHSSHKDRLSWLTFAIVGAGYTGVEAAGEFNAFLREATRPYRHIEESDVRVMLIQRSGRILDALDETTSQKASAVLERNGVEIRLNESISRINQSSFELESGETVRSHTVIWSAGVAPPPLLGQLDLPVNHHGYLECDPDLRVQGHENIWGIGDCASNPDPQNNPYPPTAQHALQEGRKAAENIAAVISGRPTEPLRYRSKGTMAALGGRQAIANILGMHLTGILAWFLWRSVYLGIMPGIGRKLRVATDWTIDLFFSRDYSQLNHSTADRNRDGDSN